MASNSIHRKEQILPHNLDAERAVLGAILLHNESFHVAAEIIDPQDFFRDAHRRIFANMVTLANRSDAIDLVTLREELLRTGEFDEIGGPAYITSLIDGVPRSANVEHYARIIKEKAVRRKQIAAAKQIEVAAYDDGGEDSDRVIAGAVDRLGGLAAPDGESDGCELEITRLSDVTARPVSFLWPGRIADGKLNGFVGEPDRGKTWVWNDVVARVTRGAEWPDGTGRARLGNVVILAGEDGLDDTIRPRIESMGGDAERVYCIEATKPRGTRQSRAFCLDKDIHRLAAAIRTFRPVLVVIDPITSYFGSEKNSHNDTEVRSVLMPLVTLAEKTKTAVVFTAHLNKNEKGSASNRMMGSKAFLGLPRICLVFGFDPDEPNPWAYGSRKVMALFKRNVVKGHVPPLGYRLIDDHVEWLGSRPEVRIDQLMSDQSSPRGSGGDEAIERAEQFLVTYLADGAYHQSAEVEAAGRTAGLPKGAIWNARQRVCDKAKKVGFGDGGPWQIRLKAEYRREASPPVVAFPVQRVRDSGIYGDSVDVSAQGSTTSSLISDAKIYGKDSAPVDGWGEV